MENIYVSSIIALHYMHLMVTLDCFQSLNVSNFSLAEYHGMVLYLVLLSMVVVIGPFSG
jgi:hypothetical protein